MNLPHNNIRLPNLNNVARNKFQILRLTDALRTSVRQVRIIDETIARVKHLRFLLAFPLRQDASLHDVVGTCDRVVMDGRGNPSWILQENHAVFPAWEGGYGDGLENGALHCLFLAGD